MMTLTERLVAVPLAYRIWQAPFASAKFGPVLAHNDLRQAERVLDVGCGPGTNAGHFRGADYVGIDINPRYVAHAQHRQPGRFIVADATALPRTDGDPYDFILVNSLLHHLPDEQVRSLLADLSGSLAPNGFIHILELVLPQRRSVARRLAQWDRGDFARPTSEWRDLFEQRFQPTVLEQYEVGIAGLTLWNMVYFKGCPR
jgi:SAM-dependent methyltransferase